MQPKIPDGRIVAVVGASGSGKTQWVKRQMKGATRQLIWDPQCQWGEGRVVVTTRAGLIKAIQKKEVSIAYQPRTLDDFDFWCRCAFVFAQVGADYGVQSVIVAEEIADVTHPGKAPPGWGTLVRRVRAFGGIVFAITQAPSESDKTVFRNAMEYHCCALSEEPDRKSMARRLDIPYEQVQSLNQGKLEYLHKYRLTGEIERGRLTF